MAAVRDTGVPLLHLKAWRNAKVLSMGQVAEKAGLSRAAISKFELQRSRARITTVQKLAKALGITPQQLLFEEPPTYRRQAAG